MLSRIINLKVTNLSYIARANMSKALVLGAYQAEENGPRILTKTAATFDQQVQGKLTTLVDQFGPNKKGKAKVFYGLHPEYPVVTVVGLGSNYASYNASEDIHEDRENVRCAMATGAKSVRDEAGVEEIHLDPCNDAEASAEGANLALWVFDELKSEKYRKKPVKVKLSSLSSDEADKCAFQRGEILAKAQNVCRRLAEMPANLMTPTIFAQHAIDLFKPFSNVKVIVRDRQWAEEKKMGSFLSVTNGSEQPPKFLELHYNNKSDSKPFVMVGKGICFDSGGISLKPGLNMDKMRADMMGAANVVSTVYALAALNAQVNVIGLTPLCENLPSGKATKPGDVVVAMNGKSIQVDNTDAEGRLVLADALCYAHEFDPQGMFDIATLTGAIGIALGPAAFGAFANDTEMYELLRKCGARTGDRPWRMPLFSYYKGQVTDSQLADCLNIGKNQREGGPCTAAAFLAEFVKCNKWMHLDIANVMESRDETPYSVRGFTGRPVRTLSYFIQSFFNPQKPNF